MHRSSSSRYDNKPKTSPCTLSSYSIHPSNPPTLSTLSTHPINPFSPPTLLTLLTHSLHPLHPGFYVALYYDPILLQFKLLNRPAVDYSVQTIFWIYTTTGFATMVSDQAVIFTGSPCLFAYYFSADKQYNHCCSNEMIFVLTMCILFFILYIT